MNSLPLSLERLKELHLRYKKFLPAFFFVAGFIWDSLTLTRIDRLSDNLVLLAYLLGAGLLIIIINLHQSGLLQNKLILRFSQWYPSILQFFFGGLFSSYVIFYFHSATLTKSALFLLVLTALLILNEFWEKKLHNLYLQIVIFYFVSLSFFIFFIPVIIKRMNYFTFLSAGVLSFLLTGLILYILFRKGIFEPPLILYKLLGLIFSIFFLVNLFYQFNLIPPVPLSLKFIGIYNHVTKTDGSFLLQYEKPPWYLFWKKSNYVVHHSPGEKIFCFSSIFAPTELTKKIYHHWQYYSKGTGWQSAGRIGFQIIGGREKGFRGYTYKTGLSPGLWRVDVETEEGLLVGRITFKVFNRDPSKPLKLESFTY